MARLRQPDAPADVARPAWLHQFIPGDWLDPAAPVDQPEGFSAGGHDPAEVRWCRLAVEARHRWNTARQTWFFEHGEPEDAYRVQLTGRAREDIDPEEVHLG